MLSSLLVAIAGTVIGLYVQPRIKSGAQYLSKRLEAWINKRDSEMATYGVTDDLLTLVDQHGDETLKKRTVEFLRSDPSLDEVRSAYALSLIHI